MRQDCPLNNLDEFSVNIELRLGLANSKSGSGFRFLCPDPQKIMRIRMWVISATDAGAYSGYPDP